MRLNYIKIERMHKLIQAEGVRCNADTKYRLQYNIEFWKKSMYEYKLQLFKVNIVMQKLQEKAKLVDEHFALIDIIPLRDVVCSTHNRNL